MKKLTQERIRELFDYREDGNLVRKAAVGRNRVGDPVGCIYEYGYLRVKIASDLYMVHQLVWLWHHGYLPEHDVDHVDRNRLNNRIENLRETSRQCNMRNTGNRADNTSGIKGVVWYRRDGKWMVRVVVNQRQYFLGRHEDFTEAVAHRLAAEQAEGWEGCDSNSPAFQYMQNYINEGITLH